MASNRSLQRQTENEVKDIFTRTVQLITKSAGPKAFRPKRPVNAAVVDSIMTGIATRLIKGLQIKALDRLTVRIEDLLKNKLYLNAVETGTSEEGKVHDRIKLAVKAFGDLK